MSQAIKVLEVRKMKQVSVGAVAAMAFLILTVCLAQGLSEPNKDADDAAQTSSAVARKPRVETVTMVDFYLRDGNAVSGKLLSEDKNQVVVELPGFAIAREHSAGL